MMFAYRITLLAMLCMMGFTGCESSIDASPESVANDEAVSSALVVDAGGQRPAPPTPLAPYSNAYTLKTLMKSRGCVWDGFLNGLGDTNNFIALLERSGCQYLHRALETWGIGPDFELARSIMARVRKPNLVYGIFIAEAISLNTEYFFQDEGRNFNFPSMCKRDTIGKWGPNTCIPSYASLEYQKYLLFITKRAIDIGIIDFAFGQTYMCEPGSPWPNVLPGLLAQIRAYATSRGKTVVFGGQTNSMTDENYVRAFDYIYGGVGEHADGTLENGDCRSVPQNYCWALLWHPRWASKANDVLVTFDWSSIINDDISLFASMPPATRKSLIEQYYGFFLNKGVGFMMPYRVPLPQGPSLCRNWEYSPDRLYTCADEGHMLATMTAPRAPDLARCSAPRDCNSNVCFDGYCGFKPNGWGCTTDDVCASNNCAAGTCSPRLSDFSRCTTNKMCTANICLDGYCGLKPNGWGCTRDNVCASNYCAAGFCAARKPDYSVCTASNQCLANFCIDGHCGLKPAGWGCITSSVCASHRCVNQVCQ